MFLCFSKLDGGCSEKVEDDDSRLFSSFVLGKTAPQASLSLRLSALQVLCFWRIKAEREFPIF